MNDLALYLKEIIEDADSEDIFIEVLCSLIVYNNDNSLRKISSETAAANIKLLINFLTKNKNFSLQEK